MNYSEKSRKKETASRTSKLTRKKSSTEQIINRQSVECSVDELKISPEYINILLNLHVAVCAEAIF